MYYAWRAVAGPAALPLAHPAAGIHPGFIMRPWDRRIVQHTFIVVFSKMHAASRIFIAN